MLQRCCFTGPGPGRGSARRCASPAGQRALLGTQGCGDATLSHKPRLVLIAQGAHTRATQVRRGKKGFFLLLFSLFSSQISLSLCFLGVTCALPHKEYCTRKRLVYSRESVKCFKEEFSSKKRWVLTKKEGTS